MIEDTLQSAFDALAPSTQNVARRVVSGICEVLGDRLLGVYAYGSAVIGDFDQEVSDLDLTAVLARDAEPADLEALRNLHDRLATEHPEWRDRIEVQYISRDALQTFRIRRNQMINISPGEPIHVIDTGIDWLANWHFIVDYGAVLVGLPVAQVFPQISQHEFVEHTRKHARSWIDRLDDLDRSQSQSYAILTNCRALYTHRTGKQVSKRVAAEWVAQEFPEWADAIDDALTLRRNPAFAAPDTANRAKDMVTEIVAIIHRESTTQR